MTTELLILLLLLLANGAFSMTELAVVSAKRGKLQRLAEEGDLRARAALNLAEHPTRFLSTVQLGITAIAIFSGLFGGETFAVRLQTWLNDFPFFAPHASWLSKVLVVGLITFLSIVVGELIPKRLALTNPEGISRFVAGFMSKLAWLCTPVVHVLSTTTDFLLKLFGVGPRSESSVTDEEIVDLMLEGRRTGVFDEEEQEMVESVLSLDSLAVKEIMTPRPKIVFIGRDEPPEQVWHKIVVSGHSIFPVYEGTRDNVVGIVSIKSLYANTAAGTSARVRDLMIKPLVVPETQNVRQLLESLRKHRFHVALVADEFGSIAGMVTMSDVAQAVLGDIPTLDERLQPSAKKREDGSWLIDGLYDIESAEEELEGVEFPEEAGRDYQTLAGFVVSQLSHVPTEGEFFDWKGWRFEIIDMDRHRVDKILVTKLDNSTNQPGSGQEAEAAA